MPLRNLAKAVFKTSLADSTTPARRLAGLLFIYRTALILAGLAAAVLIMRRGLDPTGMTWIALVYFVGWYLLLCAGTLPQLRNIEMRYFLPADVLLLLPLAGFAARRSARDLPDGEQRLPDTPG